jgi:ribosomal protein S17E
MVIFNSLDQEFGSDLDHEKRKLSLPYLSHSKQLRGSVASAETRKVMH